MSRYPGSLNTDLVGDETSPLRAGPELLPSWSDGPVVARSAVDPVLPRAVTPRQAEVIEAIARYGSQKAAAAELGITLPVLKMHLTVAYDALRVPSFVPALLALGWLRLPGDEG